MVKKKAADKMYLAVSKSNGLLGARYSIASSVAHAEEVLAKKDVDEAPIKPKSAPQKSASLDLMTETGREMEVFKSLDAVLSFLLSSSSMVQFKYAVEPTLRKIARKETESEKAEIYSLDLTDVGEVTRALRQATNGVTAASQFPYLALIGLVSAYDVMLQKLLVIMIRHEERIASSFSRDIKLADLRSFSSLQEAADFLVEAELETILRKDHLEQLNEINQRFGLQIDTSDRCVREFLEICERRNIFTHNKGIVNRRYIAKCKSFKVDVSNVKLGERLRADRSYYKQAVSVVDELSIKIIQYVWRKVAPKERDVADTELNESAYRLIFGEEYALAERILDYGINHTGRGSDKVRRMMVVNYANAIKLGGDIKRAMDELAKLDWSATSLEFQISVAALKDDVPEVISLMRASGRDGEMRASDYREWPVFRPLRSKVEFQQAFKSVYREELAKAPVVHSPTLSSAEELQSSGAGKRKSSETGKGIVKH